MPVSVTETWRGTSRSRGSGQSDAASIVWNVVGPTTPEAAIAAVIAATQYDVNQPYDAEDPDNVLFLRNWNPPDFLSQFHSHVTASFGIPPQGGYEATTTPLNLLWKFKWDPCIDNVPYDRDVNNNPVLNAAYDPPATPDTKTITKKVLTIKRNEAFYDYVTYRTYENTVNSDTIVLTEPNGESTQFNPGDMKCVSIKPDKEYTTLDTFVTMVLTFEVYDPSDLNLTNPFQLHLLNAGSNGFYGAGNVKGRLVYADGQTQVENDKLLSATGVPLDTSILVLDDKHNPVTPVANSAAGPPPGATVESVAGGGPFPVIFLCYEKYAAVPFLPLLNQAAQ